MIENDSSSAVYDYVIRFTKWKETINKEKDNKNKCF